MSATAASTPQASIGGHPRGLATLFFTEMWERFSFYGMRALLVLFMTSQIANGGLAFTDATATAIYGIYLSSVYLFSLPGGWIADRLVGAQKAVWYGGIVIMIGHFVLAIPSTQAFFLGLVLVVLGTGLLKPNISAIVGELYTPEDSRRDAGFTIFYMGINLGGFLGPIVCGWLGESDAFGWHYGFAAAGVGMFLGLIQYRMTLRHLGDAGRFPTLDRTKPDDAAKITRGFVGVGIGLGFFTLAVLGALFGVYTIDALQMAKILGVVILVIALVYFFYIFAFGQLDSVEAKRMIVIVVLFFAASTFWSGFEQAGSSLNLFAERYTERALFGIEIPASLFQSLNSLFIIIFAPFVAATWVWLAKRNLEPSTPFKFAIGLIFLALGFVTMVGASMIVVGGDKALPTWLMMTYLLHTLGELTLSPVGLSATTKLAPKRFVGQMMGVWFLATAFGSLIAGLVAGTFDTDNLAGYPGQYMNIVMFIGGAGIVMLLFTKPIRSLMGGIK
ncbi:MAG: peptide MFS transporter [Pseudomonadota bacterium]